MARKRFGLRNLFRRGEQAGGIDLSEVEQAISPDGLRLSVTSTTTTLQILHDRMAAHGWGSLPAIQVPLTSEPAEPLPQRASDRGEEGWS